MDGRRNGDARGEPNDRGEGLNGVLEGIMIVPAEQDNREVQSPVHNPATTSIQSKQRNQYIGKE